MLGWEPAQNRLLGIINDLPQEDFQDMTVRLLKEMRFNIRKQDFTSRHLDFEATREDREGQVFLIRAVRGQKKVGPDELQMTVGKRSGEKEMSPVYISTAGFTEDASKYADMLNISLADGEKLTLLLKKFDMADDLEKVQSKRIIQEDGDRFLPSMDELENNMRWGNDFFKTGNYKKAIEYYDLVLGMKSQYDLAWLMKGNALSSMGLYEEAVDCFRKVLEYNPESEEAWYNLGASFYHLEKYDDELACYDQAISINPNYTKAWNNKGATLHHLGKYEEAVLCYDKVLKLEPDNVQVLNNRGVALKNLEDFEESLKSFDRALRKKEDYLDAWLNKGILLHDMERYGDAIDCYDVVLAKWLNPEVMLLKGVALAKLGKYMKAIDALDSALSMKPNWDIALEEKEKAERAMKEAAESRTSEAEEAARASQEARLKEQEQLEAEARIAAHDELKEIGACSNCGHVLRGEVKFCSQCGTSIILDPEDLAPGKPAELESIEEQKAIDRAMDREEMLLSESQFMNSLGKHDKALRSIEEALGISERPRLWVEKGNVLAAMKRYDEAVEAYDRALKAEPANIIALLNKESMLASVGELQAALEINDKIIEQYPEEPMVMVRRAGLLRRLGRLEEAVEGLDRTAELNPDLAEVWNAQGALLLKLEKHDDAILCIDRAIQIDPDFAEAWSNKGAAVLASGEAEKSIQYFDRAIDIDPENRSAWANKAHALYEEGRFEEAVECLEEALTFGKDPRLLNSKAWALLAMDDSDNAIEAVDMALTMDQNLALAWNTRGLAFSRKEEFAEAFDCFERALSIDPDFEDARKNRDSTQRRIELLEGGEPVRQEEKTPEETAPGLEEAIEEAQELEQEELEIEEFKCPHCGALGNIDDVFCEECGQKFTTAMKEDSAEEKLEDLLDMAEHPEKVDTHDEKPEKSNLVDELVKVPGVGFAKAQSIIDAGYDSEKKLREATSEELTEISGISDNLAQKIKKKYK